jgi:hypothetical protein
MESKISKKILSFVLVALMVLSGFVINATKEVAANQDGDYSYTVSDDVATITGYTGAGGTITIPDSLGGYNVVAIGDNAFDSCSTLTSVTIPNSVTDIGYRAFYFCTSMMFITIPDSVTSIGDGAFINCRSMTSITIPNGVTSTGNFTFSACSSLSDITITGNVKSIGERAFGDCTSLTSITIPDSVTSIGNGAFMDDTSLTSITIPDSVTIIGDGAFVGCAMTSFSIPNSLTYIGNSVFQYCDYLTSISIPNSVNTIGIAAFEYCYRLTSVSIPDSVTSIGGYAFGYCNLTSITIGRSVISIGDYAFYECDTLVSVVIPGSVISIGFGAFVFCTDLTSISFLGLVTPATVGYNWIDNTNTGIRGHAYAASNFPPPGGVWNGLTMGAYINPSPTEDYTYTLIGGKATITGYTGVGGAITIPSTFGANTTVAIGYKAFWLCTNVTSVIIPEGIASIGAYAFDSCTNLTSVTIPDSVNSIGGLAMYSCKSLTSIKVDINNPYYASVDGVLYDKQMIDLIQYPGGRVGAFTIPDTVWYFEDGAFDYSNSLTSVTIPNSINSLGTGAFWACASLTSVTIGSGVTRIGYGAFKDCSSLTSLTFLGLVSPNTDPTWIENTPASIRGHAYAASNFPAPGDVFYGLTMGSALSITLSSPPLNPQALAARNQITLSWKVPTSDGGSPITNYTLYRGTTSTSLSVLTTIGNVLRYEDSSITEGVTYYYAVSAVTLNGEGPKSNVVNASVSSNSYNLQVYCPSNALYSIQYAGIVNTFNPNYDSKAPLYGYVLVNNLKSSSITLTLISSSWIIMSKTTLSVNSGDTQVSYFNLMPRNGEKQGTIQINGPDGSSSTISISLPSNTQITFTDFQLNRDAYSFQNPYVVKVPGADVYIGAYCHGISTVAVLHYEWTKDHSKGIPLDNGPTYSQSFTGNEFATIFAYQWSQSGQALVTGLDKSGVYKNNYQDLIAQLESGHPVVLDMIGSGGHAVVAYGMIDNGDSIYFALYDSNYPIHSNSDNTNEAINWAAYNKTTNIFSYASSSSYWYDHFLAQIPKNLNVEEVSYTGLGMFFTDLYYEGAGWYEILHTIGIFACPVDVTAYDSHGNAFRLDHGSLCTTINDTIVEKVGNITIFFLPQGEDYKFVLNGTGFGSYDSYLYYLDYNNTSSKTMIFEDIPVIDGSSGYISIDYDFGHGVIENSLSGEQNVTFDYSKDGSDNAFHYLNKNVIAGQVNNYEIIDWVNLKSQSSAPVVLKEDINGDGVFEKSIPLMTDEGSNDNGHGTNDAANNLLPLAIVSVLIVAIILIVLVVRRKRKKI